MAEDTKHLELPKQATETYWIQWELNKPQPDHPFAAWANSHPIKDKPQLNSVSSEKKPRTVIIEITRKVIFDTDSPAPNTTT